MEYTKSPISVDEQIEKLEKEFDKIERQIDAESQPKQKFALNEQLRELYSKIKELKA